MKNCLIVATNLENGLYCGWRGLQEEARGIFTGVNDHEEVDDGSADVLLAKTKVWACNEVDVPVLVDKLSAVYVNCEIKVFNLAGISIRLPGELKHKQVNKDGVLPA